MASVSDEEWKDPDTGTMRLTEKCLGLLPQKFLHSLGDIVASSNTSYIDQAIASIHSMQDRGRVSSRDREEVAPLLRDESKTFKAVFGIQMVAAYWEDIGCTKAAIIEFLKTREEFIRECEAFEKKAIESNTKNGIALEDENKFRKFAISKITEMDTEAIIMCRNYIQDTGRLFEVDGVNYLEMIKEQKFGRPGGSHSLIKLPAEKISNADRQKFSGLKVSNLVSNDAVPMRVSLHELGIPHCNLVLDGPSPELLEVMTKGGFVNQSVAPAP